MMDSRRQQPRVTINKEFDSFDQFVREYVTNISRSGVFIKTAEPLPVGSLVNLKFSVVMDGVETIEGEGEVVRVDRNPSGMGVVFRKLGNYSQALVEKLLTQPSE
ncbi:MAG TPA: PilZ domain-containing protein [Polyangiaceae bacterium]|nr:PilZ domain-containing protein [Polyangiaceae bacterium]